MAKNMAQSDLARRAGKQFVQNELARDGLNPNELAKNGLAKNELKRDELENALSQALQTLARFTGEEEPAIKAPAPRNDPAQTQPLSEAEEELTRALTQLQMLTGK